MNTENESKKEHVLSHSMVIPVKHIFSDEELLQKSSEIARLISEKESEEAAKKNMAAEYKNKIDKLTADIKLISGHINNKYAYFDKPVELIANFETKKRQYRLKDSGEVVKEEDLHAADYNTLQTQLDLEERLLEEHIARQQQIEENNQAGDFAEGNDLFAPVDNLIVDKKIKGEKPVPKDNLPINYGQSFDPETDLPNDDDLEQSKD